MIESIDTPLIDWSSPIWWWQPCTTGFLFLTLGLAVVMGIMETLYYKNRQQFGKDCPVLDETLRYKLLPLVWQPVWFWSLSSVQTRQIIRGLQRRHLRCSVGCEAILAFFMEARLSLSFLRVGKVSKQLLPGSQAWELRFPPGWILVANAWMQHPAGMEFNPDTVRNEMVDFWAVATSPVAVNKFFHTVLSGWVLECYFV